MKSRFLIFLSQCNSQIFIGSFTHNKTFFLFQNFPFPKSCQNSHTLTCSITHNKTCIFNTNVHIFTIIASIWRISIKPRAWVLCDSCWFVSKGSCNRWPVEAYHLAHSYHLMVHNWIPCNVLSTNQCYSYMDAMKCVIHKSMLFRGSHISIVKLLHRAFYYFFPNMFFLRYFIS